MPYFFQSNKSWFDVLIPFYTDYCCFPFGKFARINNFIDELTYVFMSTLEIWKVALNFYAVEILLQTKLLGSICLFWSKFEAWAMFSHFLYSLERSELCETGKLCLMSYSPRVQTLVEKLKLLIQDHQKTLKEGCDSEDEFGFYFIFQC